MEKDGFEFILASFIILAKAVEDLLYQGISNPGNTVYGEGVGGWSSGVVVLSGKCSLVSGIRVSFVLVVSAWEI